MKASNGKLYGVTPEGGAHNHGVLFEYDPGTNILTKRVDFDGVNLGSSPQEGMMQATNGKLYGLTFNGGVNDDGVLYEFDPISNLIAKKVDFDLVATGRGPHHKLIQISGELYGVTGGGGENLFGTLFKFNFQSVVFTKLHDFTKLEGRFPYSGLVYYGSNLYGTTPSGGKNDKGTIYRFNYSYNVLEKVADFESTETGRTPYGGLTYIGSGKFIGLASFGGHAGEGTIYTYDASSQSLVSEYLSVNKYRLWDCRLLYATDGKFYGMNRNDGTDNNGTLFEFDPLTNSYQTLYNFDDDSRQTGCYNTQIRYPDFHRPVGNLIELELGKIMGALSEGGYDITSYYGTYPNQYCNYTTNLGGVFIYDGTGISVSYNNQQTGNDPTGSYCKLGNKVYTLNRFGGSNGGGTLVEYLYNGIGLSKTVLHSFSSSSGTPFRPEGGMEYGMNNKLYGFTSNGGINGKGAIFTYDTATNAVSFVYHFDSINGFDAKGTLSLADNGNFYGITSYGGTSNMGVLFEFDPSTNTYTKVIDFNSKNGAYPRSVKLLKGTDGFLYGTTQNGGLLNRGVVFQFNPSDHGFAIIGLPDYNQDYIAASLSIGPNNQIWGISPQSIFRYNPNNKLERKMDFNTSSEGAMPYGSLMEASDGNLYGLTRSGGLYQEGTVFKINPINNAYLKLHDFKPPFEGNHPTGTLVEFDNQLWGTTEFGTISGDGSIFSYAPITGALNTKMILTSSPGQGAHPTGSMLLGNDNLFYGLTRSGGVHNKGTLYCYNPIANTFTIKIPFNGALGANPEGSLIAHTSNQLYGLCKNGGSNNHGVLFLYNKGGGYFNVEVNFDASTTGAHPTGDLIKATNGLLYGMTSAGGGSGLGTFFVFDPNTSTITKLLDFSGNNGSTPRGSLKQTSNGKLYAMTSMGGVHGNGVLFEYDPNTSTFSKLHDLSPLKGSQPIYSALIEVSCIDSTNITQTVCDSLQSPSGIYTWVSSGLYRDTVENLAGCDSILIFNLTVNYSSDTTYSVMACDSFVSPSGHIRFVGGNYIDTILNSSGCDSIIHTSLSIYKSDTVHDTITACYKYTWPQNGMTYFSSGVYYDSLTNSSNCDSTLILYLTINRVDSATEYVISADPYTWTVNGQTYSSSGVYSHVLSNVFGCDSIMILNLNMVAAKSSELWGLTSKGGSSDLGVAFKLDSTASISYQSLSESSAKRATATPIVVNDLLVGTSYQGGAHGRGVIYTYNTVTGSYSEVHHFTYNDGWLSTRKLLRHPTNPDLVYGICSTGGAHSGGTLFEFNLNTNTFTKLYDFNNASGKSPRNIVWRFGDIFGVTYSGGALGYGTIYRYDPTIHSFVLMHNFTGANGRNPYNIMWSNDGKFYGTTYGGGLNDAGVLYQYDAIGNVFVNVLDLDTTNLNDAWGELVQDKYNSSNNVLLGMTSNGGALGKGAIFSFDVKQNKLVEEFTFNGINGRTPNAFLNYSPSHSCYYSVTHKGGTKDAGTIFKYSQVTGTHTKLYDHDQATGALPYDGLAIFNSDTLYGTTWEGGKKNQGVLFSFVLSSGTFKGLNHFNFVSGSNPYGSFVQHENELLYAMTQSGGSNDCGSIIEVNPFTGNLDKRFDLDTTLGCNPHGDLVVSNGKLYGLTYKGGNLGFGGILELDPSSDSIRLVHSFDQTNGAYPFGTMLSSPSGTLLGLTSAGGSLNAGVVFELDPVSGTYTKLADFTGPNGANPQGRLTLANNGKYYGLSLSGGIHQFGTGVLFEFDPNTNALVSKFNYGPTTSCPSCGGSPYGSLVSASDNMLYGMTITGGSAPSASGTIFRFDPATGNYTKLVDFDGTNGGNPRGDLIEASDGLLYGMTSSGGSSGVGTIFNLNPASGHFMKIVDFTGINGSMPHGNLLEVGPCNIDSIFSTITVCDSMVSPGGDQIWRVSGLYIDTLKNELGCDSIVVTDLTVNYSSPIISGLQYINAMGVGSTNLDAAASVDPDGFGNFYLSGTFYGTADFDPGTGTASISSNGNRDAFLAKYDANGNYQWALNAGGSGNDLMRGAHTDNNGNTWITGNFSGTASFDPTSSAGNLTAAPGGSKLYLAKYDKNGNYLWAFKLDGNNVSEGRKVVVDHNGNIFVAGYFGGTCDFDPGSGTANLTSNGGWDIFLAKYDASGNYLWAIRMGSSSSAELARGLAVDMNGNPLVGGNFYGTADFDPGTGTANLVSNGSSDLFLAKYDPNGNYLWAFGLGGGDRDYVQEVAVDGNNNPVITGYFRNSTDFNPSGGAIITAQGWDGYLAKYDPNGNYLWAFGLGGAGTDNGEGVHVDAANNIYFIGHGTHTWDMDPSSKQVLLSAAYRDAFLAKYDPEGKHLWSGVVGGPVVATYSDAGSAITSSSSGRVAISGYFSGTADFDPSDSVETRTSNGSTDAFMALYDQDGEAAYFERQTVCDSYFWNTNGMTFTETGYYVDTLSNVSGCDSIVALDLTVLKSTDTILVIDTCAIVTSASGKHVWDSSGVYFDTIPNVAGCDSIITYDLTIDFIKTTLFVDACNAYVSPSNKYVWDSSGVYLDTVLGEDGCEIFFTINLNLGKSTSMVIDTTVCDSLVTPSGRFLTHSGVFVDTSINAAGCDSVLIYDLTVLPSSQGFMVATACDSMLSPSGAYDWTSSGIYYDTLINAVGCDSILLVDLTIIHSTSSSISATACDSYTSPSGNYTWTSTGVYHDTIPNAAGCDSTMVIDLTIDNNSLFTQNVVVCDSFVSPTGKVYTTSGTYNDTLPSAIGCDSIITTHLVVEPVQVLDLILVDANTGSDVGPLSNGSVINKNTQGPWSIRAEVCDISKVGSVRFHINSQYHRNENIAPYSINGDGGGNYTPWNPNSGSYQIEAIPYSGKNGGGTQGISRMITIAIIDSLSVDCNGDTAGTAYLNDCGICVEGNTGFGPDEGKDDCGVCFGNNADKDCNGDCFGSAVIDSCGDCVLGNTGLPFNGGCNVDCNGDLNGTAFIDSCGICAGGNTGRLPNADKDTCGVCFGNNLSCAPCQPLEVVDLVLVDVNSGMDITSLHNGFILNKSAYGPISVRADVCDPGAVGSVQFFVNGVIEKNENIAPYAINGDNSKGYKPWSKPAGNYILTAIPYSGGSGNGTVGIGLTYNIIIIDALSVDCNGDTAGTAFINNCGICVGGNTGKPTNFGEDDCGVCFGNNADKDCNGDCFGSAVIDSCGDCVLGNTGLPFNGGCNVDCNGDLNGTAFIDSCGICAGGNTGLVPNADMDTCGVCFGNGLSCASCVPNEVVEMILMQSGKGGAIIKTLNPIDTVIKSQTGSFSIDARVCSDPDVESVKYYVNGIIERTENIPPYAIAGDNASVGFKPWNVGQGNYLITAIPYSGNNGGGTTGISLTVDLWVFDIPPARSGGVNNTDLTSGLDQTDPYTPSGGSEPTESDIIAGVETEPGMLVYPNPTTGEVFIDIVRTQNLDADMVLMDATGKIIEHIDLHSNNDVIKHQMQMEYLESGVYMIRVIMGDYILTQQVIKR